MYNVQRNDMAAKKKTLKNKAEFKETFNISRGGYFKA